MRSSQVVLDDDCGGDDDETRPLLSSNQVRLVRRSVDPRPNQQRVEGAMGHRYLYVLNDDIDPASLLHQWKNQPGRLELLETLPLLSAVW